MAKRIEREVFSDYNEDSQKFYVRILWFDKTPHNEQ